MNGNVGHHRIESGPRKRERQGDVGNKKADTRTEPGPRPRDGLARDIDRGHGIAFVGHSRGVIPRPGPQFQDGLHMRVAKRRQERLDPPAFPVKIATRITQLPEERVPVLSTSDGGHNRKLRRKQRRSFAH
jgi:hypothetical protein